jgi:hypothetical protein
MADLPGIDMEILRGKYRFQIISVIEGQKDFLSSAGTMNDALDVAYSIAQVEHLKVRNCHWYDDIPEKPEDGIYITQIV